MSGLNHDRPTGNPLSKLGQLCAQYLKEPPADPTSRRPWERVRFGDYEVDLRTKELWRDGVRLKLAGQPFVILEMLLEQPGELITRDQLRSRLWADDTFVDFDHGLNAAVRRLRDVLGDSATNPKYVETLPRRGYRFLAQVEKLAPDHSTVSSTSSLLRQRPMVDYRLLPRRTAISRGVRMMTGLIQDVRFAFRQLRKKPGFAAVGALTLALGIGASSIIFSIVYNGVLYPFPYRSAERLTAIMVKSPDGQEGRGMFPLSDVKALREGNHSFEDILAYGLWYVTYTHDSLTEMVKGVGAAPNAMDFWGVSPLLGRGFGERDVQSGAAPVVLLNYLYWKKQFHGDQNIVGKTMLLNGKDRTIIGVMPQRFQAVGADLYMPISWTRPEPERVRFDFDVDDPLFFWATGILKRDVSLETAAADLDVTFRQLAPMHPDNYPKTFRVETKWLNDVVVGDFKKTYLLLFAAVGLLLFISCSNVAGLLLAQASARTKEISLRSALGAGRARLIRQLLSESLVLGGIGCLGGCLLSFAALKLIMLMPLNYLLPMEASLTLNRPVLLFAVGVSMLATVFCGLAPALHAIRSDLQKGLASTGVNIDSAFQHSRFRSGVVIGQVALCLILVTGAGLITRSFIALTHVDLGVPPEKVFTAGLHYPKGRYKTAAERKEFFERLLPTLTSTPGVKNATVLIGVPLLFAPSSDVTIPGKPHKERWDTQIELCSEGYFPTLGVHLIQGRLLDADDIASARKVAVVNDKLARTYFPGESAIGRQIKVNELDNIPETVHDAYFEIVGVVNNSRTFDFEGFSALPESPEKTQPKMFMPYSLSGIAGDAFAMQTGVPPASLVDTVRRKITSLDNDVVLIAPTVGGATGYSLDDVMEGTVYGKPRFAAIAFGSCAGLGFALAIVGLFSVMTYIVSLKIHDIGIRLALGASRPAILRLMLRRGALLVGGGMLIGLVISMGLTRLMSSQFPGVSAYDPLTLAIVLPMVLIAGLAACSLPAHRATQVDPMVTLRNE
ncbi:MAG TPA: ADOP family duplicated permease [Candidatus Solibacter sp.]|nr:ADOP family duplicated permease [Candidatus Solibacter sp.]